MLQDRDYIKKRMEEESGGGGVDPIQLFSTILAIAHSLPTHMKNGLTGKQRERKRERGRERKKMEI